MITDNHQKHVLEHTILLSSPEARDNPQLVQVALAHIQEHMELMNDPKVQQLMQMIHAEVIPGQQPPMPGQMPGGQPPQAADMMNAAPPVVQQAQGVNQPNMPSPPAGADQRSADLINAAKGQ